MSSKSKNKVKSMFRKEFKVEHYNIATSTPGECEDVWYVWHKPSKVYVGMFRIKPTMEVIRMRIVANRLLGA